MTVFLSNYTKIQGKIVCSKLKECSQWKMFVVHVVPSSSTMSHASPSNLVGLALSFSSLTPLQAPNEGFFCLILH